MLNDSHESVISRNLEDEMKESYLRYSMSVIIARALPDVRDGLKPSQRRILFAMRQLNLNPGAKHRKCAKICGDTSGDYHPHGESVIYPTLVRMAQDWALRYPLVDGQGNFGSIDGDPPAAMRYTEARLTNGSLELMDDLDKDTVDMVPNYDETKTEPVVFPSKFPNLLCNGSSGIAVGMATNIPPHNLNELIQAVLLILANPDTTIAEILEVMPGPDFPTGGEICGKEIIQEIYATGRGKLRLRATLATEDHAENNRQSIVLTEMPYSVNKSRLVEQIADLVNDKVLSGISDVRDESDKDGIRVVLELKRGECPEVVINQLYRFTDIQTTFGANMLALDKNLPRTMSITKMIKAWVDHRMDVICRRTRFELGKAEARVHILEGYIRAISVLDEIVKVIKNSSSKEEARLQLRSRFDFSERQSNAVLDLRLYQLTGLEHEKIQKEHDELCAKVQEYKAILSDDLLVKEIIKNELEEINRKHSSPRRTRIIADINDFHMEDIIPNEEVIITVSRDDYVKRMSVSLFKEQRRGGQGVTGVDIRKDKDLLKAIYAASTHDYLLMFTQLGQCHWVKVWQLPEGERRSKGRPLINFLEGISQEERVAAVLKVSDFEEGGYVFLATKNGVVKKVALAAFSHPRKKGIRALEIDEGDELIAARRILADTDQIMLFTHRGMAVRFNHDNVRPMGRTARGVKGVSLKNPSEDRVVACEVVSDQNLDTVLVVCENGFGKRSAVSDFRQTQRGGLGVRSIIISERNGNVLSAVTVSDSDGIVMMSALGQAIRINMHDVRVMGRSTQGVRLVNLKDSDILVAIEKLAEGVVEETSISIDTDESMKEEISLASDILSEPEVNSVE
ncbi:DNA topoisomerase (ATP-hydrolyzing) subunit A [Candidatus Clavichlamydia salmonicola]|uniref:DNA topoisomerase (ATP-hydrolyzing) subunit A n=1 Tax=Candidatus Clavichlamydia salmonicola TaxID=469812 RepID=UPI001E421709|nr:DNA topoisomerase (ATP-hydrolyzing) subunit A [Candidatus Clavichlamydia salmonicola]